MERLTRFLDQILPLLSLYPSWAKGVFLCTGMLAGISVVVFVAGYPAASKQMKAIAKKRDVAPDVQREIKDKVDRSTALFANLGLSLSEYYASSTALRLTLLTYTTAHPDIQSYVSARLPPELQRATDEVVDRMGGVRSALTSIQKDDFALACWRRSAAALPDGSLATVHRELTDEGFSESESVIDIGDIPNVSQFLMIAANNLRDNTFAKPLTAVLMTNSADIPKVGKAYDHAALRSLVFSGNLLFGFMERSRRSSNNIVASWGTAMIADMARSLPRTETFRAEVMSRYDISPEAAQELVYASDSSRLLSSDLRTALAAFDQRRGLLVLRLPD